jgi:asparagine synthase (glutamine-hydrolysing)
MGAPDRVAGSRLLGSFSPGSGPELAGASLCGEGLTCLLDGHLDNAEALRRELGVKEGLLAAGFRRWSFGLPGRLRGDFALVIWDPERREGLVAHDQLGVRPLFYSQTGGRLHFASELCDLLERLPGTPGPDPAGVAHWIALSDRPGPGTLYEGIEKLEPGELLRLEAKGVRRERYWEPRYQEPLTLPAGEFAGAVREGLRAAVGRRLDSERQTGVLLSGGLDSAAVAAVGGRDLCACSGTFPEHPETDEGELIAELRQRLGLEGLVAEVRPGGLLASSLEHLAAWRVPVAGWGDFWMLPLLRAAAERGVGTVLGGDGGDEVFAPRGYVLADALRSFRPQQVVALARRLPGAGPHVGRRQEAAMIARLAVAGAAPALPAGWRPLVATDVPGWLRRPGRRALRRGAAAASGDWKRLDGPRWWAAAAHGIVYGIGATGVYEHQRRLGRLAGVETRHPMLDLDLVELALRQPPAQTLDPRFSRPILRESMAGLLPDSVRLRPQKARFESLIISALRGPDARTVQAILCADDARIAAYVDHESLKDALFGNERLLKQQPFRWMWHVWRLLNLELWLRSFEGRERLLSPSLELSTAGIAVECR